MKHRLKAAAALLGIHPNTVKAMISDGRIAAEKDASGYWKIENEEIQRFLGQWDAASEAEESRRIGKTFILEQIEAERQNILNFLRHDIQKNGHAVPQVKDEYTDLFERVLLLGKAKKLVASIKIPSTAVNLKRGNPS